MHFKHAFWICTTSVICFIWVAIVNEKIDGIAFIFGVIAVAAFFIGLWMENVEYAEELKKAEREQLL